MDHAVQYPLRTDRERAIAKATATQLGYLLRQINTDDVVSLAAQFNREHGDGQRCTHPDSAYGHLWSALAAILRMLGVPSGDKVGMAVQDLHDHVPIDRVLDVYGSTTGR